jgi:hypothetical protein
MDKAMDVAGSIVAVTKYVERTWINDICGSQFTGVYFLRPF